jgi:hypothetical protein
MPNAKEGESTTVAPEVVKDIVDRASEEGVSPRVAKEIIDDALSEGVAPEKLKEVAEEAIQVEREDQKTTKSSDRS